MNPDKLMVSPEMSNLIYSNFIEKLFESLLQLLKTNRSLFKKQIIFVPSEAMKEWLQMHLAHRLGGVLGIEIKSTSQFIGSVEEDFFYYSEKFCPSSTELELILWSVVETSLNKEFPCQWKSFSDFLQKSRSDEVHRLEFCKTLAALFMKYSLYGREQSGKDENSWQSYLWNEVFGADSLCETYYSRVERLETYLQETEVSSSTEFFFFGISYLPSLYLDLTKEVLKKNRVHFLVLSPCRLFIGDQKSIFESLSIRKWWGKKNTNKQFIEELESYLRERNALLANFGKMGREFFSAIEELPFTFDNSYFIDFNLSQERAYSELLFSDVEESKEEKTALKVLQGDLLLMRQPSYFSNYREVELSERDRSIVVHQATSKSREVEVVMNQVIEILNQDRCAQLNDILILAPNICDYEGYIHSHLQKIPHLDYEIWDSNLGRKGAVWQSFRKLIEFVCGKWDLESFEELLNLPLIQKKYLISEYDVGQILEILSSTCLKWGLDSKHRIKYLKEEGLSTYEEDSTGTWEQVWSDLVDYCLFYSGRDLEQECSPILKEERFLKLREIALNQSVITVLGKIFFDLKEVSKSILMGEKKPISYWIDELSNVLNQFFSSISLDDPSKYESDQLKDSLKNIEEVSRRINSRGNQELISSFDLFYKILVPRVEDRIGKWGQLSRQALRWCSLKPMRSIPSKYIIVMGMSEGSLPRIDIKKPFQWGLEEGFKYIPTRADLDRYTFLELILSARKRLIITYSNDGSSEESTPCLLLEELLTYLDVMGSYQGKGFCDLHQIHHPHFAHDKAYFESSKLPLAISGTKNKTKKSLFAELEKTIPLFKKSKQIYSPRELQNLIVNPLAHFSFSNRQRLPRFNRAKSPLLSPLELSFWERLAWHNFLEDQEFEKQFKRENSLGVMGQLTRLRLQDRISSLQKLRSLVPDEEGLDIFLSECPVLDEPIIRGKQVTYPSVSLELDEDKITIEGLVSQVRLQSPILFTKEARAFREFAKFWPNLLILKKIGALEAKQIYMVDLGGRWLRRVDIQGIDPEKHLISLIKYARDAQERPSPLLPEWIPLFFKKDWESVREKMRSSYSDPNFFNEEAKWSYFQTYIEEDFFSYWKTPLNEVWMPIKDFYQPVEIEVVKG